MNKSVQKAKELTYSDKLEYLSKFLNRYIDDCITNYTSNKERIEEITLDNTMMGLIIYAVDSEEERQRCILRELQAPFETYNFCHFDYRNEVFHILYDLLIKEDRS